MNIEPATNIASHRQGTLDVSYERIVEVLGEPNLNDDPDTVTHSWGYRVNGQEVAIWDYHGVQWSYYGDYDLLDYLFGRENIKPDNN